MNQPPLPTKRNELSRRARVVTLLGISLTALLAVIKGVAGYLGTSYALIADAVESLSDVVSSFVVWLGLKVAAQPPSEKYPFGRGRAETLAGVVVALSLFVAAIFIAVESIHEILTPHHAPAPFTLLVLGFAIFVKMGLSRLASSVGKDVGSVAVLGDARHHQTDAITSFLAFIGISIALIGGPGWESADDWAALGASIVIAINGFIILLPALGELVDRAPDSALSRHVKEVALTVEGVKGTHKCQVRKHGFDYFVYIDVLCDPDLSIRHGHDIAHNVGEAIHREIPIITRVLAHVEPADDFGRRGGNPPEIETTAV